MPKFYFHVHDGTDSRDPVGINLPDVESARAEAITAAGEMLRDLGRRVIADEWRMEVANETGRTVLTLRFRAEEHP